MKQKWKVEANFSSSAKIFYMHGREGFWIAKDKSLVLRQFLIQQYKFTRGVYDLETRDSHFRV